MTATPTPLRDTIGHMRDIADVAERYTVEELRDVLREKADELEAALSTRDEAGAVCPNCKGDGVDGEPGDGIVGDVTWTCETCNGRGKVATPPAGAENEIVGHKTLRDERGNLRHEPLTRAEANALWEQVEARDAWRKELMPDEETARQLFFEAWLRLKDFGWREAVYCPKDGTMFDAIEPGSSGVHDCNYIGEWPSGHWWAYWDGDTGPTRPALFRLKGDAQ